MDKLNPPTEESIYEKIVRAKLIYSLSGLALGLVCILGGIVLFLNGVGGSSSWTARIFSAESIITDAQAGSILFIVGLFIVLVTRFWVKYDGTTIQAVAVDQHQRELQNLREEIAESLGTIAVHEDGTLWRYALRVGDFSTFNTNWTVIMGIAQEREQDGFRGPPLVFVSQATSAGLREIEPQLHRKLVSVHEPSLHKRFYVCPRCPSSIMFDTVMKHFLLRVDRR